MRKLSCVKCGAELKLKQVGSVEIDWCLRCGGLWLDKSELQQLASMDEAALEELYEDLGEAAEATGQTSPYRSAAAEEISDARRLDSPCPACAGKLTSGLVGEITLEICSACGGVFLDAGELAGATAQIRGRGHQLATIAALARSVSTRGTIGE